MNDDGIILKRENHLATIVFNRPERNNALDETMWRALDDAVAALEQEVPRVVIVTGGGARAFCAGMDLNPDNPQIERVMDAVLRKERGPVEQLIASLRRVMDRLVSLPVPIIAALNGSAHGGGAELAARCDLRVIDPAAVIRFSEVSLGLMPDWGGGVALTRLVGPGRASDLILTARAVSALEALQLGLVNRISAPGAALAEAVDLAEAIAANGPRAVRSALAVLRQTHDQSLDCALAYESEQAVALILSGECLHGIGAFLSKKPPEFPEAL